MSPQIESAHEVGDRFDTAGSMAADALSTLLGAMLGIYIGQPTGIYIGR